MADRLMQVPVTVGTSPGELMGPPVNKLLVDQGDGTHAEKVVTTSGLGASASQVQGSAADGAAVVGNPVRVGGKDGSGNTQDLITDTTGNLSVGTGTAGTAASNVVTVQGIASGTPVIVGGAVASGATDSGNPIKVAGVNNTTLPTLTNGQRGDLQVGTRGSLNVTLFGKDGTSAVEIANASADGASVGANIGIFTTSRGLVFNGSTWDRIRSGAVIPTAALTGFQNSLPWAIYNATPTARTEGQGGPLQANPSGALLVALGDSSVTTYSASITALAPAAAATDIFEIFGSGTKTVKVRRIQISGLATAAGAYDFVALKRSTANSGGTSSSPTVVPHDSADAAGTAVVKAYTANPTTGTLVGGMRATKSTVTTVAGAIPSILTVFDWSDDRGGKPVVLRGTAQGLAINLAGATMTGGALNIDVEWTEE